MNVFFFVNFATALSLGMGTPKVPIREFQAVAGKGASLPCNIAIPKEPNVLSLIYWYRDIKHPVYTLDFRKGPPDRARHFPGEGVAGRAHFDVDEYPPTLKIEPVKVEDEGVYKCRIEYKRSRTVTRMVKLNILVPPQAVVIMDDRGQKLKRLAGPYDEGAYLSLLCEAEGGNPAPVVTWWRDGLLLDDTYFRTSQGRVRNELIVLELKRSDFMAELSCRASNTNLTEPVNASVRIDLNMKPMYARISTPPRPLRVGDELRLDCETSGSRPTARVSWRLESAVLGGERQTFFTNRNVSYGSVTLSPRLEDNGKRVTCEAENPALPHSSVHDSWALNILFPPEVSVQLGANIKYSTIKEGNDVYLECVVRANPPATDPVWYFNDVPFYGNASAGVIVSNQSLVLQKVKKEHRGRYRCTAANTEGQGESAALPLEVRYAPTCKAGQKSVYGLARSESANISCEVDADPRDVTFSWALNNSVESVPLHDFGAEGTRSVLSFAPRKMLEFGAVLCWGANSVGEQREPCVARIIPAGPPDPVRNCHVSNRSHHWLAVDCEPGYDGGLRQRFHLDVYNQPVDRLQANATAQEAPAFLAARLPPGTAFVLVVYASNEKGKSNTVALMGSTLPLDDGDNGSALIGPVSPLVAVLLAILGTLLIVGVVALALVQVRRRKPRKGVSIEEDKVQITKSVKKCAEDIVETTIACPDVVPPNNMCDSGSLECEMMKDGQSPDSAKCSKNYRNCVVALKRSWSLKKTCQEKSDIEVSLAEINYQDDIKRIPLPLSPTTVVQTAPWYEEKSGTPGSKNNIVLIVEAQSEGATTHRTMVSQQSTTTPF